MSATAVLECRELVAGYGGAPVLRGIDIVVHPGEVVLLLGPNGAGKSTTLLALAGELPVTSGRVVLGAEKASAPLFKRARAGLGYVPEERSVFKGLTCRDNLRIGRADPDKALALFPELRQRLDVRGGLLSGGEQQMLALGRALSTEPRILLADELSLGLAPLVVQRLLAAVRGAADRGCGVLLVEQHVRRAIKIADTVHVLQQGRIVLSGSTAELAGRIEEIERGYLGGPTSGSA